MADRYWVGGSGSWNSTTKWSTTSGGGSGASVPTSSDNAIFDANSGSGAAHYTVTVTANATCANLTFTPVAADGVTQFAVDNGFVIAGTFSTIGTLGNRRAWFRSSTYGLTRDMQIAIIGTVTDVDFRDIRVTGAGGTLTGTRIGNLRGCSNITFSTPKTVYWNLAGAQNWSADGWSDTSTGAANTSFFPLAQDTATFTDAGSVTGTITMNSAIPYTGTVDMSGRTSAMTLSLGAAQTIYGDWKNGSGTTLSGAQTLTFSGRNTQAITSAGKTFSGGIVLDTYGGTVELVDAFNIGANVLTVTNGTFDTKNFNVTASQISSNNSNVRGIRFGSSTITLSSTSPIVFTDPTNLTLTAGTSQITLTATSAVTFAGSGLTYYNVSFTGTTGVTHVITGTNTFNNFTLTAPAATGYMQCTFGANQTVTGTLTCAGATAIRRLFIRSNTVGTARTLTVGTLAATDCDFRDITIAGAASGSTPTRAGNCGGNSGITFTSKTVYWNLAGTQNWSATGWAPGTGGTPDINNFPLAQDTAVFDNTGSAGTVTFELGWNVGSFDASSRTTAMTLTVASGITIAVLGDWKFGTGVTSTQSGTAISFQKRTGTQTITSNGVQFGAPITINSFSGTLQLADALTVNSAGSTGINLTSGTFDAVSYNVTAGIFLSSNSNIRTLKMGSGTWTLSGSGTNTWNVDPSTNLTFYKNTANIVFSNTGNNTRGFWPGGLSYNKFTIGGTTGTGGVDFNGAGQFAEIASTKTVAYSIFFQLALTIGKWTITGTAGNVVTLVGSGGHILAGACTSGIDYLDMGSVDFAATSPGEFYAGANSTGTAGAPVYFTDKPADSTRYWVGGTGNWSDTARWSDASGGSSGFSVPRSHDDVVFDSASNATAYTATVNAVTGGIRMKSLTISGPASGNVTLAGTTAIDGIHNNVTLPATGMTRTYTGTITLSGSTTGRTFTTNGISLGNTLTINGVDCEWILGSALTGGTIAVVNGTLDCSTYNVSGIYLFSDYTTPRTVKFGSGTHTYTNNSFGVGSGAGIDFGTTENARITLTVDTGTPQINFTSISNYSNSLLGNNKTFYNLSFPTNAASIGIYGNNTFNNLTISSNSSTEIEKFVTFYANQTINGTLTSSAPADARYRNLFRSDTIGTVRTLTCAAVSFTDADFRDITIAGAAAPATGTRLGDCKGNSGITFTAAANKYWNLAAGGSWSSLAWALSSGASPAYDNFPLPQDTCIFEATGLNSGATVSTTTVSNAFGRIIGSIDMSARTSNTMTLSFNLNTNVEVYGNWINGTGVTLSSTGSFSTIDFLGRSTQQITCAGKTFPNIFFTVNSPGGSVVLQDAFAVTSTLTLTNGTFDAATYNVTVGASFASSSSNTRTLAIGSGTWVISGSGATAWNTGTTTNLTITGTGTISMTNASAKTFAGGGAAYTNVTLNQGGAGTLTITGNNTFKDITNSYKVTGATNITMGTTTQRVSQWTAAGEAGRLLTIQGTSATSPCTLVYTGASTISTDYLTITGVRAYPLTSTWSAGANSTNNGSLGWNFTAAPVAVSSYRFFFFF